MEPIQFSIRYLLIFTAAVAVQVRLCISVPVVGFTATGILIFGILLAASRHLGIGLWTTSLTTATGVFLLALILPAFQPARESNCGAYFMRRHAAQQVEAESPSNSLQYTGDPVLQPVFREQWSSRPNRNTSDTSRKSWLPSKEFAG